ncbi:MAG: hypothetical protein CMF55_04955 [Legionellales bacterium]|nr:hypothetical protein [Legionellales bacterium]
MRYPLWLISSVLALGFLLTQLSTSIFLPAMPSAQAFFQTSTHMIKSTIPYFFIGYAIGQILWGSLSDTIGRKKAWCSAVLIYTLCASCVVIWPTLPHLFFGFAGIGWCAAAYTSVGNAILKDIFGPKRVALAIACMGIVLASGPFAGSLLGTVIVYHFQWIGILVLMASYAGTLFFLSTLLIPESSEIESNSTKTSFLQRCLLVLQSPGFLMATIRLGLNFAILMAALDMLPFCLSDFFHQDTQQTGLYLTLIGLSYLTGAIVNASLIHRWTIKQLSTISQALQIIASLGLVLLILIPNLDTLLLFMSVMIILTLSAGISVPLNKAICMTSTEQFAGTCASLMKTIQTLFAVVATSIAAISDNSQNIVIFLGLMLIIILPLVIMYKRK